VQLEGWSGWKRGERWEGEGRGRRGRGEVRRERGEGHRIIGKSDVYPQAVPISFSRLYGTSDDQKM